MAGPLKCPARVVKIWDGMIRRMAERVDDVRSWDIIWGDYSDSLDYVTSKYPMRSKFTWFVDPPYAVQQTVRNSKTWYAHGDGYRESAIDYEQLARWVRALPGQVIVCEQAGATWLDSFHSLQTGSWDSQGASTREVIATWKSVHVRRKQR
jgi:hypothetical protein